MCGIEEAAVCAGGDFNARLAYDEAVGFGLEAGFVYFQHDGACGPFLGQLDVVARGGVEPGDEAFGHVFGSLAFGDDRGGRRQGELARSVHDFLRRGDDVERDGLGAGRQSAGQQECRDE